MGKAKRLKAQRRTKRRKKPEPADIIRTVRERIEERKSNQPAPAFTGPGFDAWLAPKGASTASIKSRQEIVTTIFEGQGYEGLKEFFESKGFVVDLTVRTDAHKTFAYDDHSELLIELDLMAASEYEASIQ